MGQIKMERVLFLWDVETLTHCNKYLVQIKLVKLK